MQQRKIKLQFKRFHIQAEDCVQPIFEYNGGECRVLFDRSTVSGYEVGGLGIVFRAVDPNEVEFESTPKQWCRVGVDKDSYPGETTTYYACFLNEEEGKNRKGVVFVGHTCSDDKKGTYRLGYNVRRVIKARPPKPSEDSSGLSEYFVANGLPPFNPAEIAGESKPAKKPSLLSRIGGAVLGLLTFWLYIPSIIKEGFNQTLADSTSKVLSLLSLPVSVAGWSIIGSPYILIERGWKEGFKNSIKPDPRVNEAFYQMPINFLSGILGWVVGIVLTTLFYPFTKALNYMRMCLDAIVSDKTTGLQTFAAILKLLFVTPFVFALQLLAAPVRGFWIGKDGLGRVLQTFWDTLNAQRSVAGETALGKDNDYVSIGLREVLVASVYLAVITFTVFAITLAADPTGIFAGLLVKALSLTGFTATASVVGTAFVGAGIGAAIVAVGTAVFAGVMKGLMGLAKLMGWLGESANDVICGTANRLVGAETSGREKGLAALISEHAAQSSKQTSDEIAGNSFDKTFADGLPFIETVADFFRPADVDAVKASGAAGLDSSGPEVGHAGGSDPASPLLYPGDGGL